MWRYINTINLFFQSVPENIARGLITNRALGAGAITQGNSPGTNRKTTYCSV